MKGNDGEKKIKSCNKPKNVSEYEDSGKENDCLLGTETVMQNIDS